MRILALADIDAFTWRHGPGDDVHYGFDALATYVERTKPKLLVHGHQHDDRETRHGSTRIVGVHGHELLEVS
jgi:Icc-related predicted phosphoesterase